MGKDLDWTSCLPDFSCLKSLFTSALESTLDFTSSSLASGVGVAESVGVATRSPSLVSTVGEGKVLQMSIHYFINNTLQRPGACFRVALLY